MNQPEESILFRRLADGMATEAEFQKLESRLTDDAEFRTRYVLFMDMEANLYDELAGRSVDSANVPQKHRRQGVRKSLLIAAASLLIGIVFGAFVRQPDAVNPAPVAVHAPVDSPVVPTTNPATPETHFYQANTDQLEATGVAIVTYAQRGPAVVQGDWFQVGQWLKPGILNLLDGEIQLDFQNGAQVLLQAPAQLQIQSVDAVTLISGKAAARVPDSARGFVLNAPGAAVVDLGTEFSVNVDQAGRSDVHVTDGEVEVSLLGQDGSTVKSERLKNAETVRVSKNEKSLEQVTMPRDDELVIPQRAAPPLVISDEYATAIKAAAPFAYWRFEQLVDRQVPNEMGAEFSAVLYSNEPTPSITVQNGVSTYEASPQPRYFSVESGLPKWNSDSFSIELLGCPRRIHHGALIDILSEDWTGDLNTIEVAMKTSLIHPPGAFRFFHRHPPGQSAKSGINLFDQQTCTPGRWYHIVSVKTRDSITLYINGKQVRRIEGTTGSDDELYQLCLGQMERKSTHRQFEGALDEVALYSRALTSDEISRHFQILNLSQ